MFSNSCADFIETVHKGGASPYAYSQLRGEIVSYKDPAYGYSSVVCDFLIAAIDEMAKPGGADGDDENSKRIVPSMMFGMLAATVRAYSRDTGVDLETELRGWWPAGPRVMAEAASAPALAETDLFADASESSKRC